MRRARARGQPKSRKIAKITGTPLTMAKAVLVALLLAVKSLPLVVLALSFQKEPQKMTSAAAASARKLNLFRHTPLIHSAPLTSLVGRDVYLKLDALQNSGSFKDRGMAHLCHTLQEDGVKHLISSSGGNAGLAVATVGKQLGMQVQVVVPMTTKEMVIQKLKSLGAQVTVHGENWNAADLLAREMVEEDGAAAYISPYDNPLLWTGHSSLVDEVMDELADSPPAAIVVSVGGGGLICGTLEGLERRGAMTTAVIAAETEGAASFGKAWQKGETVRLSTIDSIATSLGALEVTPVSLERARKHVEMGGIVRESICTDAEAVDACVQFSSDHRILVEPACGAALAVAYSSRLREKILTGLTDGPLVIEVCGGSGVSVELLAKWKADFPLES